MSELPCIRELLDVGAARLADVSDSPRLDAELLLGRAIDMPRSFLYAHPDDEVDEAAVGRYRATLARRENGEPLAYISGEKEFWSLTLMVSPATLVPRPETELLVEQAIGQIPRRATYRVLDLGTGSGAIALAIARERPRCDVVATDISDAALEVARTNARHLELPNVEFRQGAWCEPVSGERFEVIVSNPPYVEDDDPALAALQHEPRNALAAGPDGLDDIRIIAVAAREVAADEAVILLEHGATQGEAVAGILEAAGWRDVRCVKDLAGLARVTVGRLG